MTLAKRHRTKKDWSTVREKVKDSCCRGCDEWGDHDSAHTVPRSLGGGQHADSVIPLCRSCHDAQHRGDLELLPLMTYDEQAEAVRVLGIERARRYLTTERGE